MRLPEKRLLKKEWNQGDESPAQEAPEPESIDLESLDEMELSRLSWRVGFRLLRQEPWVAVWSVAGGFVANLLKLAPVFVALVVFLVHFSKFTVEKPEDLVIVGVRTLQWIFEPGAFLGLLGIFFVTSLASWVLGLAVDTGVLGTFRRRLLASKPIARAVFWKVLGERFGAILGWSVLRTLLQGASVALMGGIVWASMKHMVALAPAGFWGNDGLWGAAMLLGGGGTLGFGVLALVSVWFYLSLGPLIMHGDDLGEALHKGGVLLLERFGQVVRVYLGIGLIWLLIWAGYFPFYLLILELNQHAELVLLSTILQVVSDFGLAIALAVLSVWGRGVLLGYFAIQARMISRVPEIVVPETPAVAGSPVGQEISTKDISEGVASKLSLPVVQADEPGPEDLDAMLPKEHWYVSFSDLQKAVEGSSSDESE